MPTDAFLDELRALAVPLHDLSASLRTVESSAAAELRAVEPAHLPSARNLIHYLALRRQDLRELQDRLAALGLSSLGRAESCVEATLARLLELCARATGTNAEPFPERALTLAESRRRLERATDGLLGPPRKSRRVRILVTLPAEAADDPALVRALLKAGMDGARINCAHDHREAWARMIANVRRAAGELGVNCRVQMDLPGPKLRTGPLARAAGVIKLRPTRDRRGHVIAPAQLWLGSELAVPPEWLARLAEGDCIELFDAREKRRELRVRATAAGCALVECDQTVYLESGTVLVHPHASCTIGDLAPVEEPLRIAIGDTLVLTRDAIPGHAGPPAQISCTLPQVFADVKPGDRIWLDDGAIGGVVHEARADRLAVEITAAREGGAKLRADKGINLPDTTLRLPALAAHDEADLAFIAAHADLVGYSFVRRPADVIELQDRLAALGRRDLGVVLKIETREAFENLPQLLLAAMRRPDVGVMIARGDLAVELGWERLAEVQEEILWICEAAHLPVVWATQVLEHLAKEGRPSRAEITDAAMAERAECVMLNKGPHLVEAVQVLDDILRRMEAHQTKKRSMLRPLALAERFAKRAR
jgi:pyruvate kinase